ncbi:similar to Saccharomyces cerevisiae YAL051W OAF1 Oleate-activated transcription factor, acts alone and as a heterodimer with Pip2p [Maudiozyma barnettii]|nr:similar to Saccharomyces cerevisiae YAL051W OAF1 Oleate-activated transcription factor, acts alone and as a heterodimer with Pip2p [Kazachstania barnettii]
MDKLKLHIDSNLLNNEIDNENNSESGDSHDSDHNGIKKRNRISFVCQTCRKSKTKCDREKPECGRCKKMGIKCIYDVSKQVPPRIPSKDATIARLQKDVNYWKDKAMRLMNEQGIDSTDQIDNELLQSTTNDLENSKNDSSSSNNNDNNSNNDRKRSLSISVDPNVKRSHIRRLKDIQINLYKNHSTLIFSKVMKQDVKPLSENFVIIQDKFVSSLIASVFIHPSRYSMIPALTANANISRAQPSVRSNIVKLKEILMNKYKDPFQRSKINEFTDRILQSANSSRNLKIGMILSMLYNTVGHEYLEDHCLKPGEYSDLLQNFITEFEKILPPKEIVDRYKAHFYEYVHPNLPFLDIDMFEETISETVIRDPNDDTKIKINLGNTHLRYKLENLSILLVLIKLSYISYSFCDVEVRGFPSQYLSNDIVNSYPVSNDVILLAQRCLASENWCACTNENIITCLLYIWSFFAFSPEEGDFFLEHPTDVISSLIMMLSTSIGLHRDPYDFPQLRDQSLSDKRILNQRRLLWISVVGVCSFESTLKGRHPILSMDLVSSFMDIRSPDFSKNYIERVRKDLDYDFLRKCTNNNEELLKNKVHRILSIHEFTLIRAQFSILLSDLDNLTLSYNNSFSLECIELSREKIENFIEESLPLIDFREISTESVNKNHEPNNIDSDPSNIPLSREEQERRYIEKLNFYSFKNSNALQTRLMNMLMMLRTSEAIFLHFELKVGEDKEKYFPYYYEYLVRSCKDSLTLIKMFNDFFTDKYKHYLLPSSYYNVRKILQLALPTTIFSTLGIILRVNLACNELYAKCQEMTNAKTLYDTDLFRELNRKLEVISILQKDLEMAIEFIYIFSSENLRFRYFSVFKMFALFDVIVQRMRKGELWQGILKLPNADNLHSKIVKTLRMTLGVELNKKQQLIQELDKRNHIGEIPLDDLVELCKTVKEIYNVIPRPPQEEVDHQATKVKKEDETNSMNVGVSNETKISDFQMGNDKNVIPGERSHSPYSKIPTSDNLHMLSSAASISNSLNIDPSTFDQKSTNFNNTPNNNGIIQNGSSSEINKDKSDTPSQSNNSLASQFVQSTKGPSVNGNYEFSGFLGGLDLFDYDFLFGSDIS